MTTEREEVARNVIRAYAPEISAIAECRPVDTEAPADVLALEAAAQCMAAIAALNDDGGTHANRLLTLEGAR